MVSFFLLVIIYFSFISLGLPDSLLGSAWPSMYNLLGVPLHYAGFISMIVAGGTVVSSIFSEKIIRRYGTGIVTAVSVLMTAIALIGFSISHDFMGTSGNTFYRMTLGNLSQQKKNKLLFNKF
jgi:MFS family permease